jgi:hypothetical protein
MASTGSIKKLATRVFAGFRKHSFGGNARLAFPADIQVSTLNNFFFLLYIKYKFSLGSSSGCSARTF